jgi:hypothetical protein
MAHTVKEESLRKMEFYGRSIGLPAGVDRNFLWIVSTNHPKGPQFFFEERVILKPQSAIQVYECKSTSVRGHMFENYLTASTKISPVAEPSGSCLHELLPFYLLPTEFRRYAAG